MADLRLCIIFKFVTDTRSKRQQIIILQNKYASVIVCKRNICISTGFSADNYANQINKKSKVDKNWGLKKTIANWN